MKKILINLCLLILFLTAFSALTQAQNSCNVSAYFFRYNATEGLNVRSGAGTNFRVLTTLAPNNHGEITYYVFHITGERNGWFRFNRITDKDGQTVRTGRAWVFGNLLAVSTPNSSSQIKARAMPRNSSRVVQNISPEKEYGIKGCQGSWAKLQFAAGRGNRMQTGWVAEYDYCGDTYKCASFYDSTANPIDPTEKKCDAAAFISNPRSGVNVRADAGTNFTILRTIPANRDNTMVFIEGSRGDWLKISSAINRRGTSLFKGTGWVYAPLLSVKLDGVQALTGNGLKIYKAPRKNSDKISFTGSGVNARIQTCQGNWIKVQLPVTGTGVSNLKAFGWVTNGSFCGTPWGDCL